VIRTQVRSASVASRAWAATISVSSLTTPSCLSRSSTPTGEDLHPDVVAVPGDVGHRTGCRVVDEGGGAVLEQRDGGYLLPAHDRRGQLLGQVMMVRECSLSGIDVDHRHCCLPCSFGSQLRSCNWPFFDLPEAANGSNGHASQPLSFVERIVVGIGRGFTPSRVRRTRQLDATMQICAMTVGT
jgi:hypothetical protein